MAQPVVGSRDAPSCASFATASTSSSASLASASTRPSMPRQRSRGQIARRHSITRGSDVSHGGNDRSVATDVTAKQVPKQASQAEQQKSKRYARSRIVTGSASRRGDSSNRLRTAAAVSGAGGERPWLGGLYFTDVIFIAFTYTVNLLRTLGLAELADVVFKGCMYALTQLPIDLYRRWSLSTPPYNATAPARKNAAKIRRRKKRQSQRRSTHGTAPTSSSESDPFDVPLSAQPPVFASSHEDEPSATVVEQLSPFHHLVILLSKFASGNFPHLLPRVLFAEETIGPFVYWRTGGGSNAMVQEFTDVRREGKTALTEGASGVSMTEDDAQSRGSFRAYLLSKDARMPIEVQRANFAARRATTLLYLHGGGFSLGSVAFYAEALLRLRAKIALLESDEPYDVNNPVAEARCVAVEYDLSPTARFPLPLLQCLRCYAHLIEVEKVDADSICIAGDSAGGNLAMGMLLCLDGQMRDDPLMAERDWSLLPMPGKAMLISPWVDLRPSTAHAFGNLRKRAGLSPSDKRGGERAVQEKVSAPQTSSERAADAWTEAVAQYDWDYVASESLLHFAQVYAGVLPLPRRVHGPLGWIAHVCGVLALQYDDMLDDKSAAAAPKGFMDPSRALSVLSRPSRRLARATHHALNDPILPRLLGLNTNGGGESSDSVATRSESITAGFEPLFTQSERRTDVVASTAQLFESIEGPLSASGADKIGIDPASAHARLRGRNLLDTHALLSPATGDWSRIKLKHGCLVTWGERERMADDIEAWVDAMGSQRDALGVKTDAPPAPDGQAHVDGGDGGEAHRHDTDGDDDDDNDLDWVYTAVEKGPGGVHAWPFVSMYLAGAEAERERGLDLLARFVARTHAETVERLPDGDGASLSVPALQYLPEMDTPSACPDVDPPHAAPYSSDSADEEGSIGSMPSDVDLHGLVDEEAMTDHLAGFGAVNIADAVRRAQELGFVETDVDDETTMSESSNSMPLTPRSATTRTVRIASPPVQPPPPPPPPHLIAPPAPMVRSPAAMARSVAREPERERGRSRSPRKPVHMTSTPPATSRDSASPFFSSVQLHRPQSMDASPDTERGQTVTPLWWTGSNVGARTSRSLEEDSDDGRTAGAVQAQTAALPPIVAGSTTTKQIEMGDCTVTSSLDDTTGYSLHDIAEASSDEALSPARSSSPPSTEDASDFVANLSVAIDPHSYSVRGGGLSRWAIQRPEPEGLSDIAEEGSVLSASVTSAGDEDRSRSLSPPSPPWRSGHHEHGGSPSLTEAATQFMQSQPSTKTSLTAEVRQTPQQWRFLRDEIGVRRQTVDHDDGEEDDGRVGNVSLSTPAHARPGRSLPLEASALSSNRNNASTTSNVDVSASSSDDGEAHSGALGIGSRKKPKGDVWW